MPFDIVQQPASTSDSICSKEECLLYEVNLTQPSGEGIKHRLAYQLFCITQGEFITSKYVSQAPTNYLNFMDDICGLLDTPCPTIDSTNVWQPSEESTKGVSLFLNTLEIDTDTCESSEVDGFSSNEKTVINAVRQCDDNIDWSQTQVLSYRPTEMHFCPDADLIMNLWVQGSEQIRVFVDGSLLGGTTLTGGNAGQVYGVNLNLFKGLANDSITLEVAGKSYSFILDECCCCQEVKFFEPIGGWTNISFCKIGQPFTVSSEEINSRQANCNCDTERVNISARVGYTLETTFCSTNLNPNFLPALTASKRAAIKINGKWIDFKVNDGSFEFANETNEVTLSITGTYSKNFIVK